jgi:hypothetical protein
MRTYFDHEKLDDARDSATECAACLDAVVAKGVCSTGEIRIASMLTKLIEWFDVPPSSASSSSIIREEPDEEGFDDKDEDDNETEDEDQH